MKTKNPVICRTYPVIIITFFNNRMYFFPAEEFTPLNKFEFGSVEPVKAIPKCLGNKSFAGPKHK